MSHVKDRRKSLAMPTLIDQYWNGFQYLEFSGRQRNPYGRPTGDEQDLSAGRRGKVQAFEHGLIAWSRPRVELHCGTLQAA